MAIIFHARFLSSRATPLRHLPGPPIAALNRAIALAQARGPAAGLRAIALLHDRRALERYHLFHAVRGRLLADAGQTRAAALPAERGLLAGKLRALRNRQAPA